MSGSYRPIWIEARKHRIIPLGIGNGTILQPLMVNIVFPVIQNKRQLLLREYKLSVEMATYETMSGNEIQIYVFEDIIVIRKKCLYMYIRRKIKT